MPRGRPKGSVTRAANPLETMQIGKPPRATARRGRRAGVSVIDPTKPKRPLSAFFCFASVERPRIRAINPELSVGQVAKEMGKRWNTLTNAEKVPFERLADEDKARYRLEMQDYMEGNSTPSAMGKSDGQAAANPIYDVDDDMDDE